MLEKPFSTIYFLNKSVEIRSFDLLPSTQDYLRQYIGSASDLAPIIVVAQEQSKGAGRRGRSWFSPRGGLWFSFAFRCSLDGDKTTAVGLLAATALIEALEKQAKLNYGIKWPNDIVVKGRKLAGLLSDVFLEEEQSPTIVLGIGVNTNNTLDDHLRMKFNATSVIDETGVELNNQEILSLFVKCFDSILVEYANEPQAMIDYIKNFVTNLGEKIEVELSDRVLRGLCVDISERGELVLEDSLGARRILSVSEVTRIR
jgi:BirA family biotin operon repressor/biotin-[acetyl-CoA-carboxylase] ligase